MDDRIRYVYKVFDKLNEDKFYIGTTFDIKNRWKRHKKDSNSHKLKADMLEFGTQDFDIEIIFSGTENEAYAEEMRLIAELKPYYNNPGDIGGNFMIDNNKGEHHSGSKFIKQDIIDICNRVVVNGEQVSEVAKDYPQVANENSIYRIVNGNAWDSIKEAPRRKAGEIGVKGENNGQSKLIRQDIIDICNRVVVNSESVTSVAKDYPQITKELIYQIIRGSSWDSVKEAPRKKLSKNFTKEEVLDIRTLAFEGKTPEDIQKTLCPHKEVKTVKRVITGKSFANYEGPQKGRDY